MSGELWRLSAVEAVALLKKKEISPLDLIEAASGSSSVNSSPFGLII